MQTAVPQQRAVEHRSITPPEGYFIVLPDADLPGFAQCPLAIGVQLAVARLCMCAGGRVPVSRADLAAWCADCATRDGALSSAIKYAIDKLRAAGLLDGQAEPGKKLWLQPGWGLGRDGKVRPWNWDRLDRGRPRGLSFRKIPTALFDTYLGTCQTDAHDPAQVERWFDQSLIDFTDLGAYALRCAGVRVAGCFLVRLRHLGLINERDQPVQPQSRWALLLQAASDTLTTIDDDGQVVTVQLSEQGRHALARKGGVVPEPPPASLAGGGPNRGSNSGALSADDDPASPCAKPALDEAPFAAWERVKRSEIQSNPPSQPEMIMAEAEEVIVHLDLKIQAGHRLVNTDREIPNADWLALLALQEEIGVARLLTWQARAAAAGRSQVSPAYYRHCAASEAFGSVRLAQPPAGASSARAEERQEPLRAPVLLAPPAPARPALDAEQQAALRELEQAAGEPVRAPWRLAGTSPACIRAWAQCIAHPGLLAYCRKPPLHYAVDQMALCLPPPNATQLARWAESVAPGVTGGEGPRAGGERWSGTTIASLVAGGGGLFSLGGDVGDVAVARPGGPPPPAAPPAGPPRAAPGAPAAPGPRPAAAPPAGPRFGLGREPARPPAGQPGAAPAGPAPGTRPTAEPPGDPRSALPLEPARPPGGPPRGAPAAPIAPGQQAAAPPANPPSESEADQWCWSCALGVLQRELPRATFAAWVRGARWGGLAGGVATVVAARPDQAEALRRLAPQLERALVGAFGQAMTVVVEDSYVEPSGPSPHPPARSAAPPEPAPAAQPVPPGQPAPPGPSAPAWIAPAAWATVPPTLRVALAGARIEQGQVVASSALFQRVIDRHADVLRELLDDAGGVA